VASLERKPGTHAVFNLEVDAEHTYLVGRTGLFTHNICVGDEVFVPRSDGSVSAGKVIAVIDEHSVRVEVRTPDGPGWKIVRTDSLRAFSADTAIGARTGLGDVVRASDDDLLVRRPGDAGNRLDDAYRAAHEGARVDFYEYFTSGEAITPERLASELQRLHGNVAADYRGEGGLPVNPGRFHTETGLASGSPLRRADVAGELHRAGFSADEIANLTAEGPVRVRGIADGQLPQNAHGRHFYPGAADHGAYLEAAARRLETLRTMPLNKTAFANELADYYHTLVNGRFFGQVNNSLWLDQVNSLLRSVGHPGIAHGQLDFVALTVDYESFRRVFHEALREAARRGSVRRISGSILVNAFAGFAAEFAFADESLEQLGGAELFADLAVEVFEDGEAHVEADEVRQLERAHGVPVAKLHGLVDVLGAGHAGLEHADGLGAEGHAKAAARETRHVVHHDGLLADAFAEGHGGVDDGSGPFPCRARSRAAPSPAPG
jgi:hypothetical protein